MADQIYNDPINAAESTIGTQVRTDHYVKKALIDLVKEKFFTPYADVTVMPRNMGKKIKQYHYVPMLDDRNINDQGIDAAGATLVTSTFNVNFPSTTLVIADADSAAAVVAINDGLGADIATDGADGSAGTGFTAITLTATTENYSTEVKADAAAADVGGVVKQNYGNLYGSTKDVGSIVGKLPALSETGGYVNRVGFTRVLLEGSLEKYGFYDTYTKESRDFDSDAELDMHVNREMLRGANEITEDLLQIDLLNAAGVIRYAGAAVSDATMTGVTADTVSEVDYDDFSRLAISLDNNRCPKDTKIISGSRMVDTRTLTAARVMMIGSELLPTIERITDHFSNQAYIPASHYAAAGNIANGEVGQLGHFRIVVAPDMMHWAGVGAVEGTNAGYQTTNGHYNVYPMLVIGNESFTTIGFETSGNMTKFKIKHSKPESPESYANDPFGETGFMSIKFYYGFMALRTERIALIKTVART